MPIPIELRQASKLEALHLSVRANEVFAERLEAHCFVANSPKASVQQLDQPETAEQWNDALLWLSRWFCIGLLCAPCERRVREANEEERMNGTRKKRASQVGLTSTVATTPLRRPPLEAALDAFTRELRGALDRATAETTTLRAEVAAIRAELQQLRQRHDAHKHNYLGTSSGGGGQQWIELRFLQSYIDGEQPGYKNYGIWARGRSSTSAPPEYQTSGPSA